MNYSLVQICTFSVKISSRDFLYLKIQNKKKVSSERMVKYIKILPCFKKYIFLVPKISPALFKGLYYVQWKNFSPLKSEITVLITYIDVIFCNVRQFFAIFAKNVLCILFFCFKIIL